ncbi:hypothetical protein ACFPH6_20345 [Streptomyces xiangluensis]|uniref:Uncharacterized protein n=1 Tax=Streptomyces xiangluensis TaxID=2665720 RepID=A0ABV8YNI4_9ACTN
MTILANITVACGVFPLLGFVVLGGLAGRDLSLSDYLSHKITGMEQLGQLKVHLYVAAEGTVSPGLTYSPWGRSSG